MLRGKIRQTAILALIAAGSVNCWPGLANEPRSSLHDNSGRRLAQLLPIAPPTVTPAGHAGVSSAPNWTAALDRLNARANQAAEAASGRVASFSSPVELTPAAQEALAQGAAAAQTMTRLAAKRFADFVSWGAVLFHNLNDVPRLTPTTDVAPLSIESAGPTSPAANMKDSQQIF